jgi:glucosamine-6-phosphate deaminase
MTWLPDSSLQIMTFPDDRVLARKLAADVASAVRANPRLILGLPTGRTPVRLYRELATLHAHGELDLSHATTFNLDEFVGIDQSHPGSYRTFMQQHLFSRVNLAPERIHFLNGAAPDLAAECHRYEAEITAAGGIDLQLLGIGTNGHVGFNEPARGLVARTHLVTLKAETRRSNAGLFGGDAERVPHEALSMGMVTILHARRIILIATGKSKARCIDRMVSGPITPKLPASFLQLHRHVTLMIDEAAGSDLH